jgi:pimeloyl-ACP methyl ester carboxylesterase
MLTNLNSFRYNHLTAEIEGLTIHFIHQKSTAPNAIPLILSHGWPGLFLEFLPLVEPLLQSSNISTGTPIAFDIIIPSLPGFAFSSAPPQNWTHVDTARVFNTLMTEVLGYSKYAVYGTDMGSFISYRMYDSYNISVRAAHFSFLPFYPLSPAQLAALNISLSPQETFQAQLTESYTSVGLGYNIEQSTEARSQP